jgi:hypothetical protein
MGWKEGFLVGRVTLNNKPRNWTLVRIETEPKVDLRGDIHAQKKTNIEPCFNPLYMCHKIRFAQKT